MQLSIAQLPKGSRTMKLNSQVRNHDPEFHSLCTPRSPVSLNFQQRKPGHFYMWNRNW